MRREHMKVKIFRKKSTDLLENKLTKTHQHSREMGKVRSYRADTFTDTTSQIIVHT